MLHLLFLVSTAPLALEDLELLDEQVLAVAPHAVAIDKRLKLAQCPEDPIIAPAVGGSVVVRCTQLGWRLRVAVRQPAAMRSYGETVIRKGEMVECVSGGPGFSISSMMLALDDAAAGQPVRVKSPTSSLIVTATAKARGIVSF